VTITHFSAVLLFSLFTSVVFGITQRSEPKMIAASWLMWLIKH
jgi:hypothetical protein